MMFTSFFPSGENESSVRSEKERSPEGFPSKEIDRTWLWYIFSMWYIILPLLAALVMIFIFLSKGWHG